MMHQAASCTKKKCLMHLVATATRIADDCIMHQSKNLLLTDIYTHMHTHTHTHAHVIPPKFGMLHDAPDALMQS